MPSTVYPMGNASSTNDRVNDELPWYVDPLGVLLAPDKVNTIVPSIGMTRTEALNAFVRLSIVFALSSLIVTGHRIVLICPIVAMLASYCVLEGERRHRFPGAETSAASQYNIHPGPSKMVHDFGTPLSATHPTVHDESCRGHVHKTTGSCRKPTLENPFMNPMPGDDETSLLQNEFDIPACHGPGIAEQSKSLFDARDEAMFRDTDDLFGHAGPDRQFYTVPSTTTPNAQHAFADALYGDMQSKKQDGIFAYAH